MTSVFLAPAPLLNTQFIPGGNTPAAGAQLFAYIAGSSTKQNTFTTSAGNVANSNPIVLDSGGNLTGSREIWLTGGQTYKFVLAPSTDTDPPISPYWSIDNISGVNDTTLTDSEWVLGPAPIFINASSFALGGDQTAIFTTGRRLKTLNTAGTFYSTASSSVFGTSTTVGIQSDSTGLDSGLSQVSYGIINPKNTSLPIIVSVLNFGAKGDGVTNDSIAIQAGIDYLFGLGGGDLYFPKGNYLCNIIVKSGVNLIGSLGIFGNSNTFSVRLTQAASGAIVDTPVVAQVCIGVVGIQFFGIGSGTPGKGVYFRNVTRGSIRNCSFDNFADEGVRHDAGEACEFQMLQIQNCLLNRTKVLPTGAFHIDSATDDYVEKVESTTSLSAVSVNGNCHGIYLGGSNHFCVSSIGEISDSGWYIAGSLCRLAVCRGDLNFGHGFQLTGSQNNLNCCLATNNSQGTTNTFSGFYFTVSTAQSNILTGCLAFSSVTNVHKYGFEDYAQYAATSARQVFVGCISVGQGTSDFRMEDNQGSSVQVPPQQLHSATVSATLSIDVTETGQIIFDQGSGTSVVAFTNGHPGQDLTLVGNTNITIKNNTVIKNASGADLTLAANRVYLYKYANGIFYQV